LQRSKLIHEDVVSHLYGSVAAIEGPDNLEGVEIYLYSPAQLDSYASTEIGTLRMHFVQLDYPKWHRKHEYYFRRKRLRAYR
jgi:hypothetical protein